jgi:hypothetical protein
MFPAMSAAASRGKDPFADFGGKFGTDRVVRKRGKWYIEDENGTTVGGPYRDKKAAIKDAKSMNESIINEGSHSLWTVIKTKSEKQFFKKYQMMVDAARAQNPGSEGYSGDWDTIPEVRIEEMPFSYKGVAMREHKFTKKIERLLVNYLLDVTEKWEPAKAVKTPKGYYVAGWAVS